MAKSKVLNGNLKFYIYIALLIAAIASSFAIFGRDVLEMKPEVDLNTEHRIRGDAMEAEINHKLEAILSEVQK